MFIININIIIILYGRQLFIVGRAQYIFCNFRIVIDNDRNITSCNIAILLNFIMH